MCKIRLLGVFCSGLMADKMRFPLANELIKRPVLQLMQTLETNIKFRKGDCLHDPRYGSPSYYEQQNWGMYVIAM